MTTITDTPCPSCKRAGGVIVEQDDETMAQCTYCGHKFRVDLTVQEQDMASYIDNVLKSIGCTGFQFVRGDE